MKTKLVLALLCFCIGATVQAERLYDCEIPSPAPKLTLVGEQHEEPFLERIKDLAFFRQPERQILAIEGLYPGQEDQVQDYCVRRKLCVPPASQVRGIDDPLTHTMVMPLLLQSMIAETLFDAEGKPRDLKDPATRGALDSTIDRIGLNIFDNPLAKETWLKMGKKEATFQNAEGKEDSEKRKAFDAIAEVFKKSSVAEVKSYLKDYKSGPMRSEPMKVLELLSSWFSELTAKTGTEKDVPDGLVDTIRAYELTGVGINEIFQMIAIEWRNKRMATNLAKAYCDAVKQNKPLVAIVGSDHLSGLRDLLAKDGRVAIDAIDLRPALKISEGLNLIAAPLKEFIKPFRRAVTPPPGSPPLSPRKKTVEH